MGTTRPVVVNLSILHEWLDWLIHLGPSQDCEFAGWGTEAPFGPALPNARGKHLTNRTDGPA